MVIAPQSASYYRSDATARSEKKCAALEWAFVIMELFNDVVKRHVKKVVDPPHCGGLDIEAIRNMLNSGTSSIELVREGFSQMLEFERCMKHGVRIEERGHSCDRVTYQKRALDMLRIQVKICPKERKILLWTAEKNGVSHYRCHLFRTWEGTVCWSMLQTLADWSF